MVCRLSCRNSILDLEVHSVNSSDQNEELMPSVSDSEELDADKQGGTLAE